jgi:hypothetical protein
MFSLLGSCSSYDVSFLIEKLFFFIENTKHEKLDTGEQEKKVQVECGCHKVLKWLRSMSYSNVPAVVDEYWSTDA